jgi:hypothetical protein
VKSDGKAKVAASTAVREAVSRRAGDAKTRAAARPEPARSNGRKVPAAASGRKPAAAPSRRGTAKRPAVRASTTKPVARGKARPASRPAGRVTRLHAPKGAALKRRAVPGRHLALVPAPRVVKIRALDPYQMCGARTSVVHLYRVDERDDGKSAVHLVFFDRHGWYCEHGKTCRAVEDVRRHGKQLGLTF